MATRLASQEIGDLDPYKFMPRTAKAVPYLGYSVIAGTKPA